MADHLKHMAGTGMSDLDHTGAFKRKDAAFRNWVRADGSTDFKPAAGRYHLYVSYACPWASRTLMVRALKGLEDVISVTVVKPVMEKTRPQDPEDHHLGWALPTSEGEYPDATPDPLNGCRTIREVYELANPDYKERFTVPVLYDKKTRRIVSNESSEIIRMLNAEFNDVAAHAGLDLYPQALRAQIDEVNGWVYDGINNGVYKAGFASSQGAYETAATGVFEALDRVEAILAKQRYLCGAWFTEADVRLFVTLIRFDEVYVVHFKCNKRFIADYPNMFNYVKEIYQMPGIAATVNMHHIKVHYYCSHKQINPFGVVPIGQGVDFTLPHDRNRFPKEN
eukprot:jgi/Mesvir1/22782/Mv14172-RA.1